MLMQRLTGMDVYMQVWSVLITGIAKAPGPEHMDEGSALLTYGLHMLLDLPLHNS